VRGTNFCTDALLGAIYAELGLMAVTADMEHLRNHEGQESSHSEPVAAVLIGDVWNSPFRQHRWLCSSEQKE
jgi:hypothetical protein